MTTSKSNREPDFDHDVPLIQLLADTLDYVDQTVARVTTADVERRLRQLLASAGCPPEAGPPECQQPVSVDASSVEIQLADWMAVEAAHRQAHAARREAETVRAEAQRLADAYVDSALARAAAEVATARSQAEQIIAAAKEQAADEVAAARSQAEQIIAAAKEQAATVTAQVHQAGKPPTPGGHGPFTADSRSVVLYKGQGVVLTTVFFESEGARFPLAELDYVERVEHGGWLQARMYELWAWFGDQRVRLFHCYDSQEFGQVCRALTRAREHARVELGPPGDTDHPVQPRLSVSTGGE